MKKERSNIEKLAHSKNETANSLQNEEDESLNLDELLDVQGGIEDDQKNQGCGLGCFTGAMTQQDPTNHENG
ncbi:MAG: hypothetical protein RR559_05795 [Bacteroides sp.]